MVDAVADRLAEADAHARDGRHRPAHLGEQHRPWDGPAAAPPPSRRRSRPGRARPSRRGPCAGSSRRPRGRRAAPSRPRGPGRRRRASGVPSGLTRATVRLPSLNGGRNDCARGTAGSRGPRRAPPGRRPSTSARRSRQNASVALVGPLRQRAAATAPGVEERAARQQQQAQHGGDGEGHDAASRRARPGRRGRAAAAAGPRCRAGRAAAGRRGR